MAVVKFTGGPKLSALVTPCAPVFGDASRTSDEGWSLFGSKDNGKTWELWGKRVSDMGYLQHEAESFGLPHWCIIQGNYSSTF